MSIIATVIVGFESSSDLNNNARRILTGTQVAVAGYPEAPFHKVATRTFVASNAEPETVLDAVEKLVSIIRENASALNELSMSIALAEARPGDAPRGVRWAQERKTVLCSVGLAGGCSECPAMRVRGVGAE
jgi:hypothetical protein